MIELVYSGAGIPRLDTWLTAQLPGLSGGALHKYLRQNKIKLNGKKQPLATRLTAGDVVRLYLPDEVLAPPALDPRDILYEDDSLLAVYKPAGLISQHGPKDGLAPADTNTATSAQADSLLARARHYLAGAGTLCHRLDTGTSGVLLVAKTEAMLSYVTGLLAAHRLEKTYYGLSFGHPQPPAGRLDSPMQKDRAAGHMRLAAAGAPGAQPAVTQYETLATGGPLALLRITPKTGRTHQIRVHLAGAGTPLLGDSKYGDNTANRRYRCRYQCLCAAELRFPKTEDAAFAATSGLRIACQKPWFYTKMLEEGGI